MTTHLPGVESNLPEDEPTCVHCNLEIVRVYNPLLGNHWVHRDSGLHTCDFEVPFAEPASRSHSTPAGNEADSPSDRNH